MSSEALEEGRFRYAHGLVWDNELGQGVPRSDDAHIAGEKIATLSAWTPKPRVLHIYRLPNGKNAWQWEPKPPGGRFAR